MTFAPTHPHEVPKYHPCLPLDCGALAATQSLHLCTRCRRRKYCNQACQLAAWRAGHKRECKLLKADAETKPNSNASDSAAAKTQVTNSDHPDRKNIKNHTPDQCSAEPSNGPACVDPEPYPVPDSDLPAHNDIPDSQAVRARSLLVCL